MKHFALLLLLVPTLAPADLIRCVIDGKVSYQESGCAGVKMNLSPDANVVSAPRQSTAPVNAAPAPVVGAYYGGVGTGYVQTEPTEYIHTYAGPRYYHDHGPPPYGGTGRYSPDYDHGRQWYNPRGGYYAPQPSRSGDGYRKR